MTLKEQLIREIELMPEELLAEVLDFAGFIKAKREKQQTPLEHSAELPSRKLLPILKGSNDFTRMQSVKAFPLENWCN